MDRAAHEIRNPLNGVAVNLEVVRSRLARGSGDPASIGRFAESAASESERAAELVQALLELARPLATPVDLWSAMLPMVALHRAIAGASARAAPSAEVGTALASVTLDRRGEAPLAVAASAPVARLALAAALEAAAGAGTPAVVRCSMERLADDDVEGAALVVATIRCAPPVPPLDDAVVEAIGIGGVALKRVSDGLELHFRAAGRE